jgi:hypothetical protein
MSKHDHSKRDGSGRLRSGELLVKTLAVPEQLVGLGIVRCRAPS